MEIMNTVFNTETDTTTVLVHGDHVVTSPWTEGVKNTKFIISIDKDCNVKWTPAKYSRTPDWRDVRDALQHILDNFDPEKGTVKEVTNLMGVKYKTLKGYSLGISVEGKLSIRGKDSIPANVLKRLLPLISEG